MTILIKSGSLYCAMPSFLSCRDGLVGYDAALTQRRSRVRFTVLIFLLFFLLLSIALDALDCMNIYMGN